MKRKSKTPGHFDPEKCLYRDTSKRKPWCRYAGRGWAPGACEYPTRCPREETRIILDRALERLKKKKRR